ncbi:sensor histidine kinase [Lachnoclostridium sp. Marseille-P6806]|uniref:sensor histidine kinase n=1 Tax=Lachnoclostridium sp. Marseille-P6806 TaxID=2364793 RepID=UPI00102FEDE9|nr:histidine kinase [Lachnoclostridium sp. Marseille-P6806]
MKYLNKMILYFATIAILLSAGFGVMMFRISAEYELHRQRSSLSVNTRSLITQTESCLAVMDAILNYILSDPSMLGSITMLGMTKKRQIPVTMVQEAESTVKVGLNTEYIIRNSYRTVFFNQNGFLSSSFLKGSVNSRLVETAEPGAIPYLRQAEAARGKTVLVGPHPDKWSAVSAEVEVYSLMKAVQGYRMGYLEVENTVASLGDLEQSDEGAEYVILCNGTELLYQSDPELSAERIRSLLDAAEPGTVMQEGNLIFTKLDSGKYHFSVLCYKDDASSNTRAMLIMSALAAAVVFGVSLAIIIFWANILVRPLNDLRRVIERTTLSNLKENRVQPLAGKNTTDEFKALANAYGSMINRLDTALRNEKRASLLQLQAQFDVLQAQVDPHFLYNVLNIISARGVIDEDESISEICGALANMLRYSTNNRERYATLGQELEYLGNYFFLLKARYEDRLEYLIRVEDDIRGQILPKLSLQQIVENAVKHGFAGRNGIMRIRVIGEKRDGRFLISVEDNGCGFAEDKLESLRERLAEAKKNLVTGQAAPEMEIGEMGLVNTYLRCYLLYSEQMEFRIRNTGGGAEVLFGSVMQETAFADFSLQSLPGERRQKGKT